MEQRASSLELERYFIQPPLTRALRVQEASYGQASIATNSAISSTLRDRPRPRRLHSGYLASGIDSFKGFKISVDIHSEFMTELYSNARKDAEAIMRTGMGAEGAALRAATITSRQAIGYNHIEMKGLHALPIEYYIANNACSCTHFSMMTLGLLQRFRQDGFISGNIRILNNRPDKNKPGHAWVHYESYGGKRTILDPTNCTLLSYTKSKTNRKEMRESSRTQQHWDYFENRGIRKILNEISLFSVSYGCFVCTMLSLEFGLPVAGAITAAAVIALTASIRAKNYLSHRPN